MKPDNSRSLHGRLRRLLRLLRVIERPDREQQTEQVIIHPHPPPSREKLQQRRIWMRLDSFVQQERLLACGDKLAISDFPHCHVDMHR